jgi:hypothetical protein
MVGLTSSRRSLRGLGREYAVASAARTCSRSSRVPLQTQHHRAARDAVLQSIAMGEQLIPDRGSNEVRAVGDRTLPEPANQSARRSTNPRLIVIFPTLIPCAGSPAIETVPSAHHLDHPHGWLHACAPPLCQGATRRAALHPPLRHQPSGFIQVSMSLVEADPRQRLFRYRPGRGAAPASAPGEKWRRGGPPPHPR